MPYTMYIDESGDHFTSDAHDVSKRYLGLVSVIIGEAAEAQLDLDLEALKRRHLKLDPARPSPCLHRAEVIRAQRAFSALRDDAVRASFDTELLDIIERTNFRVIAVVIDKFTHVPKAYRVVSHPYHYGIHILLERFCDRLSEIDATGRVIAEARGKKEDKQLKSEYDSVYRNGTLYLKAARAQTVLQSPDLTLADKHAHLGGLELADMLAKSLTRDVLIHAGVPNIEYDGPFGRRLAALCEPKYHRKNGRISGFGRLLKG